MRYLIIILSIVAVSCSTQPTTDYCEQATLTQYITYDDKINRAYFKTDNREYYINLDAETGLSLVEGNTYTVCFDSNNNFVEIKR